MRLMPGAMQCPSPNTGNRYVVPRCIIIHYTAGRDYESSLRWLTDPASRVSAHFLVGRKGQLAQLVPVGLDAWHAGSSKWREYDRLNRYSVGIELDNHGLLKGEPGNYRTWYGDKVPDRDTITLTHPQTGVPSGWHRYTDQQLRKLDEVILWVRSQYDKRALSVIGHYQVAPTRKIDPGPAFPGFSYVT